MKLVLLAASLFASILLLGCAYGEKGRAGSWLSDDFVESEIRQQHQIISNSGEALSSHARAMLNLRTNADIVLKLDSQQRIHVMRSKTGLNSILTFSINDVEKYCSAHAKDMTFDLVVIVVPLTLPVEEGKPDALDALRSLDTQLRTAGFKRRVFQISEGSHWYQLDSGR